MRRENAMESHNRCVTKEQMAIWADLGPEEQNEILEKAIRCQVCRAIFLRQITENRVSCFRIHHSLFATGT